MPAPTIEDALQLLRHDHARLRALFGEYALLSGGDVQAASADRQGLLARLSVHLRAHLQVEQELFYPALAERIGAERLHRSHDDHAALQARLEDVSRAQPLDPHFDTCVAALAEAVHEHLKSEEDELFPAAAGLDLQALGTLMALRRGALLGDLGMD
jgi:iron-sulfur cluster repair protein YtfE (RIC family)